MNRRSFFRSLGVIAGAMVLAPSMVRKAKPQIKAISQYVLGYKGAQFMEAGIVYAPYIPLYQTSIIEPPKYSHSELVKRFAVPFNKNYYKKYAVYGPPKPWWQQIFS